MNDQELETRLRARYRARATETDAAPPALRRDIAAVARDATTGHRFFGRGRGVTLLAAAALLLVGGALVAGSGLLQRTTVLPPVPAPSLAAVVAPSPEAPSPAPSDLVRHSASSVSVEGPVGTWIRTGSLINPGDGNLVRLLDGRVLAMGGDSSDGVSGRTAELYDPATGTWSATGSPIRDVRFAPATLLPDGRVLAGTPDVAELYDPATGTWTATGTTPIDSCDCYPTSSLLRNGKVLVVFGYVNSQGRGRAMLYDPTSGTWTATSKSSATLYDTTLVTLPDGRVLVAGGATACDRCSIKSTAVYDPQTDSWAGSADMPWPGQGVRATLLQDGTVLFDIHDAILGSERGGVALYDPSTATWTAVKNPPKLAKLGGLTRLLDGLVLMTMPDGTAAVYDPATRSWTKAASMLPNPDGGYPASQATLLLDGTVLVTGGPGAQLYIPAGVAPPNGLAPVPEPTPTPTPTPIPTPGPTPFPPGAGPIPHGARPWTVTVENKSSKTVTLFLAREPLNDMGDLCGSVTPDVVRAGVTKKVTFQMPPKSEKDCWLMIQPGPGADGAFGPTDGWPIPGPRTLLVSDGGDNANGDDLSTVWVGP